MGHVVVEEARNEWISHANTIGLCVDIVIIVVENDFGCTGIQWSDGLKWNEMIFIHTVKDSVDAFINGEVCK